MPTISTSNRSSSCVPAACCTAGHTAGALFHAPSRAGHTQRRRHRQSSHKADSSGRNRDPCSIFVVLRRAKPAQPKPPALLRRMLRPGDKKQVHREFLVLAADKASRRAAHSSEKIPIFPFSCLSNYFFSLSLPALLCLAYKYTAPRFRENVRALRESAYYHARRSCNTYNRADHLPLFVVCHIPYKSSPFPRPHFVPNLHLPPAATLPLFFATTNPPARTTFHSSLITARGAITPTLFPIPLCR